MLLTYLNATPHSKFIFLEDSLEVSADPFIKFIITSRLKFTTYDIHYAIYEGVYSRKQIPMVTTYNLTNNLKNLEGDLTLEGIVDNFKTPCILFIDSLMHVIYKYGFKEAYRLMHKILNNVNVLQVVAVFHCDFADDETLIGCFEYLSTISINLEKSYGPDVRPRANYKYKKPGGKVIAQIEEYYIENDMLKTEPIKKIDPAKFLRETTEQITPDELTTFKISLDEKEKQARDSVVLPYLPRNGEMEEDGVVFYQFDAADDWDAEDPDDDLDI